MKYSGNLSAFTLGGTSYLGDFENVSFEVGSDTEEGKGGAQRHSNKVIVKQEFKATCSLMRTVTSVRETTLDLTTLTLGAIDLKPDVRTLNLNINSTLQECSGRADRYKTYQAVGTMFSGSGTLQVQDAATTDLVESMIGALTSLQTTLTIDLGGTAAELPVTLTKAWYTLERDGLYIVSFEFTQRGTPTSITGNTLVALILTGTALCAIVTTITTLGDRSGSTVIESCTLTMPEQGILKETYNFTGLGAPSVT